MKTRYFLMLFVCTTGLLFCCEDSGTDPDNNGVDTTSHDYTWRIDTIGYPGSVFLDVSIIDENDIWIVGEIWTSETGTLDSNGFTIDPFNAVHWNGDNWQYYRLQSRDFTGQFIEVRIQSVFAFSSDDIWMCSISNSYLYWDGSQWETGFLSESRGVLNKIWGSSSSNLYVVGNNGSISHYDGSTWRLLESYTNIELTDIFGSPDGGVVWACGYTIEGTVLVKIKNTQVEKVYEDFDNMVNIREDTLSTALTSLWTNKNNEVYVISPGGMYRAKETTKGEAERIWFTSGYAPGFPRIIRGIAGNDIFIGGDFSFFAHYNGNSWRQYNFQSSQIKITAIDISEKSVIGVGKDLDSNEGIVLKNY